MGSNGGDGLGGAGLGGPFFSGLGANGLGSSGTSGLLGIGMPELDQMQQHLTQNPNVMREIINMPVIQNIMNNPDLMRNMIMSNPQMRTIMDQNPELAHVLNDPSTLRQTLEAARNPELMREMMRNTDRAMSNIEATPEGFNMLRRMYETVQEPFLNATTMSGDSETDSRADLFSSPTENQAANYLARQAANNRSYTASGSPAPNTNPLPNPWSNTAGGTQPANTRSAPARDAQAPRVTGLSGLGDQASGMQDSSFLNQFMQNPAMAQMMQNLLSDPQYVNQMLSLNPQTRSLVESNTQLREMLQNPEFLRQMASPETMQQLLSSQQSLFSQSGRIQSGQVQNQTGGGTGAPNSIGLDMLMNMFGGLGAGGLGVPTNPNVPPEELYATQLAQLQEMGFFDTQENIRALSATGGNVHAAVERLLGNLGR